MPPQPLEPPPSHPDEPPFVCIQINEKWIPYIIGLMWPAKFPEYWAGTLEENRNARRDVQNLINQFQELGGCDTVSNCCLDLYVIQRVDVTTGAVQVSVDGGITWQPKPGVLATKIIEPVPPVISGVAVDKCQAANNANTKCLEYIENVSTNFTEGVLIIDFGLAVAGNIVAIALILLGQPELIPIETAVLTDIGVAVTGAFEAGKAAWDTYWSIENKQTLFCAMVCTIGDDGAWTQSQFEKLYARVGRDLPTHVAKTLFLAMMGQVNRQGFNVMSAQPSDANLSCDDCNCACDQDFRNFTKYDLVSGTIIIATRTCDLLEVTSQLRPDGLHWVAVIDIVEDVFVRGHDKTGTVTSGQTYWSVAGEDPHRALNTWHFGIPPTYGTLLVNGIAFSSHTPFTAALTKSDIYP